MNIRAIHHHDLTSIKLRDGRTIRNGTGLSRISMLRLLKRPPSLRFLQKLGKIYRLNARLSGFRINYLISEFMNLDGQDRSLLKLCLFAS